MTILITGGCGFIGTNFIINFAKQFPDETIINLDKLTYAANLGVDELHKRFITNRRYKQCVGDIGSHALVRDLIVKYKPEMIINFAAESHVDRSINDSSPFIKTNVMGTMNLLDCIRKYVTWDYRFLHVSTDEVYGSLLLEDPPFTEQTPYDPRSPYSASKAASDHLVNAYRHTHGLQTIITNCSNNYGPFQHQEKFIPTVILKALGGEKIPVYGNGANIRDWIYVEDHCDALIKVLLEGRIGDKYNIGGKEEKTNLDIAKYILNYLEISHDMIDFVEDRKGHDFRYAIDTTKIELGLGWYSKTFFSKGIEKTIEWYSSHRYLFRQII
jgi:dTDP-glucose 4,6-dehydratase